MRFVMLGAGAIGGVIGGQLAKAGLDVLFVDPLREHVDAINRNGLNLLGVHGHHVLFVAAQRQHFPWVGRVPHFRRVIIASGGIKGNAFGREAHRPAARDDPLTIRGESGGSDPRAVPFEDTQLFTAGGIGRQPKMRQRPRQLAEVAQALADFEGRGRLQALFAERPDKMVVRLA